MAVSLLKGTILFNYKNIGAKNYSNEGGAKEKGSRASFQMIPNVYGDGQRVKSVINGEITLFIGGYYEVLNPGTGQTVTKYYFAGASRIAMRKYTIPQSMALEYFLGDHLGSTSITTDTAGEKASEMRYEPWGEVRYTTQDLTLPTRIPLQQILKRLPQ